LDGCLHGLVFADSTRVFAFDYQHSGGRSGLENYAMGKGWVTKRLNNEPVSLQYLLDQSVKILYIANVWLPYSDRELGELKQFVQNGGAIIIEAFSLSDGYYNREVTRLFGIDITNDLILGAPVHVPITSEFAFVGYFILDGCSMFYIGYDVVRLHVLDRGAITPLLWNSHSMEEQVMMAWCQGGIDRCGGGTVVVIPKLFDIGRDDNSVFFNNLLRDHPYGLYNPIVTPEFPVAQVVLVLVVICAVVLVRRGPPPLQTGSKGQAS
jgi:hypothetical protein